MASNLQGFVFRGDPLFPSSERPVENKPYFFMIWQYWHLLFNERSYNDCGAYFSEIYSEIEVKDKRGRPRKLPSNIWKGYEVLDAEMK